MSIMELLAFVPYIQLCDIDLMANGRLEPRADLVMMSQIEQLKFGQIQPIDPKRTERRLARSSIVDDI
jgi:hypothetical protein